jgi:hypothetical protein
VSRGQRLAGYVSASSYLAGLDDHGLRTLLDGAEPLGSGIGGVTARLAVDGVPVFDNILTDGRRLYLADFGLAAGAGFDLSEAETDFLARNRSYDRAYTATLFSNWLLRETCAAPGCDPFAGACPAGTHRVELPAAAVIIERDADVASVTNRFFREFQSGPKTLPFPADEVEQALAERDRRATT